MPVAGRLEQSDATAWMFAYCLSMLRMASTLAERDPAYRDLMITFLEHAVRIAGAMNRQGLWDEEDGFYYDNLRLPDGIQRPAPDPLDDRPAADPARPSPCRARRRSSAQALGKRFARFLENAGVSEAQVRARGSLVEAAGGDSLILSLLPPVHLEQVLRVALSEDEFLSPHGLRALSRRHRDHAVPDHHRGRRRRRSTTSPASRRTTCSAATPTGAGPVWFPVNFLFIESLLRWDEGLGESFTVEYPTGSGDAAAPARRRRGPRRSGSCRSGCPTPTDIVRSHGATAKLRDDPEWRDLLLFHEYFHGETGQGIGASHQTGWTGLVAHLLCRGGTLDIATNGRRTQEPATAAAPASAGPPTPGGPVGVM